MLNHTREDDDGGGGFLPETTLQELVWRTARVLNGLLAPENRETILQHLGEPMEDGHHALRIHELMAIVSDGLSPSMVPQYVLCSSFLLLLHFPLMKAIQEGQFCPSCNPKDAVLASHLLLHQRRTWDVAAQLIPCCCDGDEAAAVRERLQSLQEQFNNGACTHPKLKAG